MIYVGNPKVLKKICPGVFGEIKPVGYCMIGKKMKKIIILIPVFNDWDSLKKLIEEINENIKDFKDINFECLIVNDASTLIDQN